MEDIIPPDSLSIKVRSAAAICGNPSSQIACYQVGPPAFSGAVKTSPLLPSWE